MSNLIPNVARTGGGLRTDILDPSIARLRPESVRARWSASATGTLAQACHKMRAYHQHRTGLRLGAHKGRGLIAQHPLEDFVSPFELRERPPILSDARVEELSEMYVGTKPPGEKPVDLNVYNDLQRRVPQFSLRNVQRLEMRMYLPHVPFQIEVWREASEHDIVQVHQELLAYCAPDLAREDLLEIMAEERQNIQEVLWGISWEEQAGNWRNPEKFRDAFIERFRGVFARQRSRGRFEDDTDRERERVQREEHVDASVAEPVAKPRPKAPLAAPKEVPEKFKHVPPHVRRMLGLDF